MKRSSIVFALLALALLALPAAAQTTVAVGYEIGDLSQYGYVRPLWGVTGSIEHETERFVLGLSGDWSPSRKFTERLVVPGVAPEYSVTAQTTSLVKFGPVLAGGGADYTLTVTDTYSKDGIRWHAGGGVQFQDGARRKVRLLYAHLFPGTDKSNDLSGESVTARLDWPIGEHTSVRLTWAQLWSRFHASNLPDSPYLHARGCMGGVGLAWTR